jgi:hypothetical protein
MKQFRSLKAIDFVKNPVWVAVHTADSDQDWYDDADEETFRPWQGELPVRPGEGMFLVAASFVTADMRLLRGIVTPQPHGEPFDLGSMQPQIFFKSGKMYGFWDGLIKRSDKDRKRLYAELGNDPDKIFPISFAAGPDLASGTISGSIPGFGWLKDGKPEYDR